MELEHNLGGKEVRTPYGSVYVIERSFNEISLPGFDKLKSFISKHQKSIGECLPSELFYNSRGRSAKDKNYDFVGSLSIKDYRFLDIESLGLKPSHPIFLVTIGKVENPFSFCSYLARDYSEERSLLHLVLEELSSSPALVTFNGRSYDLNRLGTRAQYNGLMKNGARYSKLADRMENKHIDLSDHLKKSLQIIEKTHLGYFRHKDIPSRVIPQAYKNYLSGEGNESENIQNVLDIVEHNVIDTFTLYACLLHLHSSSRQSKDSTSLKV